MKVISISGKAQHGKDTTATMLKAILEQKGKKVLITHYADSLKFICKSFFDWDGKKDEHGRHMLQYVGTDVIRSQDPNYWVDFIIGILRFFPDKWDFVLIPDCRFPNEIERFKEAGFDTIHLRVTRGCCESGLTEAQLRHMSETALDNTPSDFAIQNDGTYNDLYGEVSKFLAHAAK